MCFVFSSFHITSLNNVIRGKSALNTNNFVFHLFFIIEGLNLRESHPNNHHPSDQSARTTTIDVRSKIIATFFIIIACSLVVDLNQLSWFFLIFFLSYLLLLDRTQLESGSTNRTTVGLRMEPSVSYRFELACTVNTHLKKTH